MNALASALLAELDDRALDQLAELLAPRLTRAATNDPEPWLTVDQEADGRCGHCSGYVEGSAT